MKRLLKPVKRSDDFPTVSDKCSPQLLQALSPGAKFQKTICFLCLQGHWCWSQENLCFLFHGLYLASKERFFDTEKPFICRAVARSFLSTRLRRLELQRASSSPCSKSLFLWGGPAHRNELAHWGRTILSLRSYDIMISLW